MYIRITFSLPVIVKSREKKTVKYSTCSINILISLNYAVKTFSSELRPAFYNFCIKMTLVISQYLCTKLVQVTFLFF